jgi:hypothetical protein
MRLFVVLAAVLSLPTYGGQPLLRAQSRPFLNLREIVALVPQAGVPQAGGLDAYWNHTNELATPPFQRLMRTGLAADGTRQNASLILEGDVRSMGWAGGDAAPIVLSVHEDGTLRATVIGGTSALEEQAGKIIAQYTTFPQLACGGGHCVAFWSWGNSWHAVYLDEEGSPAGASFTLPEAWMLFDVKVGQSGIFVVRRLSNDIRAVLLRADGSVQYDVLLFQSPAAEFAEPIVNAVFDGTSHVVAYAKRPPGNVLKPAVVEAVTIAENGTFEAARTVVDAGPLGIDSFSLAWNGAQHLLTWSSGGQLRASRFTPQLIALDTESRLIGSDLWSGSVITPMPDGTFAIGWSRDGAPYAALLRPNGELTAPVALEATPRRRAAGK